MDQQDFQEKNQMRPKEERSEVQPNGPDVYETEDDWPVMVPRSEIHMHSVTLEESLESIENWIITKETQGLLQQDTNWSELSY